MLGAVAALVGVLLMHGISADHEMPPMAASAMVNHSTADADTAMAGSDHIDSMTPTIRAESAMHGSTMGTCLAVLTGLLLLMAMVGRLARRNMVGPHILATHLSRAATAVGGYKLGPPSWSTDELCVSRT